MDQFNFALIGASGFIAPRHMKAVRDTGHTLVAATDPSDSVGIIDSYFPDARFFTEIERFDRHLEKIRRRSESEKIHFVSICSPNCLHDAHVRLALRVGASAICEKPLVVNPWNLDALEELESESPGNVYTCFQLRCHNALKAFRENLLSQSRRRRADVVLTYITRRGAWYQISWKGQEEKSGGIIANIGVHFFDLLIWLFGDVHEHRIHLREKNKAAGVLEMENARVRWFLSVDGDDLPVSYREANKYTLRTLTMNGENIEFSSGFNDLHTQVYRDILAGKGLGIKEARKSIQTVYKLRYLDLSVSDQDHHPILEGGLEVAHG